jgi:hypothetical protein
MPLQILHYPLTIIVVLGPAVMKLNALLVVLDSDISSTCAHARARISGLRMLENNV